MKPSPRLAAFLIAAGALPLHAGTTWDGGGANGNWGTGDNWNDNLTPPTGTGVVLTFAGNTGLSSINNYTAWDDFGGILFASGAGAFTITGNQIDLFGKIENNSGNLQTFGIEFSFNNSSSEINPVNGNLLINGANIFNNGNTINVWGNNGRTATLDTVIQGAGGLTINQNSTVVLARNNSYSGANNVNAGTLQIGNGGSTGNFGSGSMTIGANGTLAFNRTGSFNLGGIATSAGARVRADLGTITGTAATSFGNLASGNLVVVNSGGAINLNGVNRGANTMDVTIAGTGGGSGAIHNTGAAIYGNSGVRNVTLSNNATVTVGGAGAEGNRWDFLATGTLNLAGFNLTKEGGGNLVIRSTPGTAGTITASAGTIGFEDNFTGASTANHNISVAAGAAVGGYNGRDIRSAVTLNGSTAALYDQGGTRTNFTNVTLNNGGRIDQSNRVYGTSGSGIGIDGTMGGTGNLTISGGDRGLYLAGTHAFTGVTTIDLQSGHIEINGAANSGNLVSNAVLNLATTASTNRAVDLWGGNAEFRGLTGGNDNIRIVGNNSTTRTLTINTPTSESYSYSGILQNRTWNSGASPYNLVKTGEGTQILSNANSSWSGALTINGGTLTASGASGNTNTALGLSSGSRTVTINNGGTLSLTGNNVFGGSSQTLANTIKTVINAGGVQTTTAYNVVGNIDLNGGTLTATGGSNSSYQSYEFNGGTITAGGSAASTISASGTNSGMHIAGGKTLTLNVGDVTTGTDLVVSAALVNGSSDRPGAGALLKTGAGTLLLSGSNSYSGGTTLSQGTIIATNGNALGTGGTVTINDAGTGSGNTAILLGNVAMGRPITVANQGTGTVTLGVNGSQANPEFSGAITLARSVTLDGTGNTDRLTFTGGIGGTGNVAIAGGSNRVVFNSTANTYDGTTTVNAGSILQLGVGGSTTTSFIPDSSVVTVNSGAFLKLAKGSNSETIGGLSGTGTVRGHEGVGGTASSIIIDNTGSDVFGGVLENGGASGSTLSLTKTGSGTQTLSGTNTYTGGTTVTQGTLLINGATSTFSSVSVGSGGTLGGSGTVGGNTTILGALAPGNSAGTLTFTNDLGLGADSDWLVEIGGTGLNDFDRVLVGGQLSAASTISLSLINGFAPSLGQSFQIATFGSFVNNGYTFDFTNAPLDPGLSWNTSNFASNGTLTVIPEPAAAMLGGIGLLMLLRRRR